jgi:hypothetical protein
MSHVKDLTGQTFTRLKVIARDLNPPNQYGAYWTCKCICGKVISVIGKKLRNGHTTSCGCRQREVVGTQFRTHGLSGTPLYRMWSNMKSRCENPEDKDYANYGAKGIECHFTFEEFYAELGNRPSPRHSIDRFPNNTGHYEPGNVRWATVWEQANNRPDNRLITFNHTTRTIAEWERHLGFNKGTLYYRFNAGWSIKKALTTQV